jgi:hypothetical protein
MGLQVARSFKGTEEQGMIKTTIKFTAPTTTTDRLEKLKAVDDWMNAMLGPAVPRNNNKSRRRKRWSTRINYWGGVGVNPAGTIEVFTRDHQSATLVALRWM